MSEYCDICKVSHFDNSELWYEHYQQVKKERDAFKKALESEAQEYHAQYSKAGSKLLKERDEARAELQREQEEHNAERLCCGDLVAENTKLQAACAAMREALLRAELMSCPYSQAQCPSVWPLDETKWCLVCAAQDVLMLEDAGIALLKRLEAAEAGMEHLEREHGCSGCKAALKAWQEASK